MILLSLFLTKKVSEYSDSILYCLVILLTSIVIKFSISWCCVNSLFTAFFNFSTNIIKNFSSFTVGSWYIPPYTHLQRLLVAGSFRYHQNWCWWCHLDSTCFRNLVCMDAWFITMTDWLSFGCQIVSSSGRGDVISS